MTAPPNRRSGAPPSIWSAISPQKARKTHLWAIGGHGHPSRVHISVSAGQRHFSLSTEQI
jgi:hypothetical protein